jgi:cation:H+ antiporter
VLEPILWFIVGLVALIGGAELLVRAVSKLAIRLGISKLIIGLTVVAFGTSAPELAVSIQAGMDGNTDLMLGNIVGSNITNTLLILGISALVIPLKVHKSLIKSDVPIMIAITLLVYLLALNGFIFFWECMLLTVILIGYLIFLIRKRGESEFTGLDKENKSKSGGIFLNTVLAFGGLAALVMGARWLIRSSLIFADIAGISELVVGLTVVAIGTSLPEIVVALMAAIRGERDIAVGGVIGSNILNFLAVLGVSGLFIPGAIPVQESLISFDMIVLIAASVLCIPIFYTGHKIVRWEGGLFLFFYFSYLYYLFLSTTAHDFLSIFINIMIWFILPVAGITVILMMLSELQYRFRFRKFGKSNKKKKNNE